jgi:hypothetical protein
VTSLAGYFRQEGTLEDWRAPYLKKLYGFITRPLSPDPDDSPVSLTDKDPENE